jgi:hypothetical protein
MGAATNTDELTPEERAEYRELRPVLRMLRRLMDRQQPGLEVEGEAKAKRTAEPKPEDYQAVMQHTRRRDRRRGT